MNTPNDSWPPKKIADALRFAALAYQRGLTQTAIGRQLGISDRTLRRWQRDYGGLGERQVDTFLTQRREIRQLQNELRGLQQEVAILRIAAEGN